MWNRFQTPPLRRLSKLATWFNISPLKERLMKPFLVFLLSLFPILACAQDLELPKEIKAKVGDFVQVESKSVNDVEWYIVDPGIQFLPFNLLKDKKTAILFTLNPGKYRLLAWTAKDNKPSPALLCLVTIEPNDFVPTPPAPPPSPAEPSALEKRLKPFYQKDTSANKKMQLEQLKKLFVQLQPITKDENITTIGQLFKNASEISSGLLEEFSLKGLRNELNLYMDETLPRVASQELDQKTRDLCFFIFGEIKTTLDKIGD